MPSPRRDEPEIEVDHATRTATLTMAVDIDGAKKRFGHISVTGQKLFSAASRPGDRALPSRRPL